MAISRMEMTGAERFDFGLPDDFVRSVAGVPPFAVNLLRLFGLRRARHGLKKRHRKN